MIRIHRVQLGRKGQVLIEHALVLLTLILPLSMGVGLWGSREYLRTRCAHTAFLQARSRLIQEDQWVKVTLDCGSGIREELSLSPLRELESRDPLSDLPSWVSRASSLWGELSHYWSSPSEPASD